MKTGFSSITPLRTSAELDEVVAIWLAGSEQAHYFIDQGYWLQHAPAMKETYLPQSETWVYRDASDTITGFVSLVDNYLASLFVHPTAQARGIGSQLIEKAKTLKNELRLAVYVKNLQAVGFYQKHGFRVEETRIDKNTGEEELVMVWKK